MNRSCVQRVCFAALAGMVCLSLAGCVTLAEDVAQQMLDSTLEKAGGDIGLIEHDFALFRACLDDHGSSRPLPHSTQAVAGQGVASHTPGSGSALAGTVGALPDGHPAKVAHQVLDNPVTKQASALHDHLRGHDLADDALGVEPADGSGDAGHSSVDWKLRLGAIDDLHRDLTRSVSGNSWHALHGHCERHHDDASAATDAATSADCRRAAFIKAYLEAYLRHAEFVTVEVHLSRLIDDINDAVGGVDSLITTLRGDIADLEADAQQTESGALAKLEADAAGLNAAAGRLSGELHADVQKVLGLAVADRVTGMVDLGKSAGDLVAALDTAASDELGRLLTRVDGVLQQMDRSLADLSSEIDSAGQRLDSGVDRELGSLSNVFRVRKSGFVSRDNTFSAMLPTLDVSIDPTVAHAFVVTDISGAQPQTLTSRSDLVDLGVARDQSGVGTGANIGAELVRVMLEAIFDAHEGLPAVAQPSRPDRPATALTLEPRYRLPLFTSPMGNVDLDDLNRMTEFNDRVAAGTRSLVSRAVGGISVFSLNNESLEQLIVEVVTTSVRKGAEKASWCWYSTNLDADFHKLDDDVRAGMHAGAEKVKLRLHLEQ